VEDPELMQNLEAQQQSNILAVIEDVFKQKFESKYALKYVIFFLKKSPSLPPDLRRLGDCAPKPRDLTHTFCCTATKPSNFVAYKKVNSDQ